MKHGLELLILMFCCLLAGALPAHADEYNNSRAMQGISKVGIYFDVSLGDARLLQTRMDLIKQTVDQMNELGVTMDIVIGIRGKASPFVTKEDHYVLEGDMEAKASIQKAIQSFVAQGITVEQCKIAADLNDIPVNDFLPEITIVRNGYVSLIGYQARGYAVVPMD